EAEKGYITEETMKRILRSHHDESKTTHIDAFSVKSVCMHAGFFYGDQTTGSYIISLKKDMPMSGWVTGSSTACISIFKPTYFSNQLENLFFEDEEDALYFWIEREQIHRLLMKVPDDNAIEYHQDRQNTEIEIKELASIAEFSKGWKLEKEFIEKYILLLEPFENERINGSLYYQSYWKKQNKQLRKNH